jgi:hypothetical protein
VDRQTLRTVLGRLEETPGIRRPIETRGEKETEEEVE